MSLRGGDFWSRRRAAVEAEQQAEADALAAEEKAVEDAALSERSDEEVLAELNLPAPEEMEDPAQVQELLRAAVPQRLRTRALRRLWRLNPVLANVDGLVEYGEDFTDAATVVENLQTIYQVGKGMFDKAVEAAEAEARAANLDADAPDPAQDETPEEAPKTAADHPRGEEVDATGDSAETAVPAAGPDLHAQSEHAPEPEPLATAPRRMRFRFEAAT